MATNIRTKIILKDNIIDLEKAINAFFTAISNKKVFGVLLSAQALFQGNKIYIANINYDSVAASASPPTVKLFEQDDIYSLQTDMDTYIAPLAAPSVIATSEIILKNGNNSFIGIAGYNFTPAIGTIQIPFAAEITSASQTSYTVNGNITGGTPGFTYQWSIKSRIESVTIGGFGVAAPVISAGDTTHTITITAPGVDILNGLLCCKITDSNGLVTYAYFSVWLVPNT